MRHCATYRQTVVGGKRDASKGPPARSKSRGKGPVDRDLKVRQGANIKQCQAKGASTSATDGKKGLPNDKGAFSSRTERRKRVPDVDRSVVSPNRFATLDEGPGGHDGTDEGKSEGTMVVPDTTESSHRNDEDKGSKATAMAPILADSEHKASKKDPKTSTSKRIRTGPKAGPQLLAEQHKGAATPDFSDPSLCQKHYKV